MAEEGLQNYFNSIYNLSTKHNSIKKEVTKSIEWTERINGNIFENKSENTFVSRSINVWGIIALEVFWY